MIMTLDGKLICIFGGGGFVGRYVAQQLLARGAKLRIAERSIKTAMHIKPSGNLGQTQFVSADVTKAETVRRAVHGCDIVINLVGIFGDGMDEVHADGAHNVAAAAAAAGANILVHISAIGADPQSPSRYGRGKAAGEQATLTAFPSAIILRPSIIFGREDKFINRFAGMIELMPVIPIFSAETRLQPIFVGDVADAVAEAVSNPAPYAGEIFELGGPEILSMGEINQRIAMMTGHQRTFIALPDMAGKMIAALFGLMPGAPISSDQYKMLGRDNIVSADNRGLAAFNVSPTPLAIVARGWMDKYRAHGRFGTRVKTI